MASLICCAGEMAACCACRALTSCCGLVSRSVGTRVTYAIMFLTASIAAWILSSSWAEDKMQSTAPSYLDFGCNDNDPSCYGTVAVYRVCLGLVLFHTFMALIMYGVSSSSDPRASIQNSWWPLKLALWLGSIIGCFFIPGSNIEQFQYPSMAGAIVFILIQLVLLVDFAHSLNDKLVAKFQDTQARIWFVLLIGLTFLFNGTAFALTVIMWTYFLPGDSSCRINTFFVTFNFLVCIVLTLVSISGKVQEHNPKSGLLQSSVVTLYSTYLVWSAVSSEPESDYPCNSLTSTDSTQNVAVVIGFILTFISVAYAAVHTGSSSGSSSEMTHVPSSSNSAIIAEQGDKSGRAAQGDDGADDDDESGGVNYSYFAFHLCFALAAMYMAEVLTGWNDISSGNNGFVISQSTAAVWAKMGSSWGVLVLYFWTLIAPMVLSNRDFS
ncbi:hypothetical protein CAOG_05132 [Capsaspora owczarzaki ATCC 30864]|uniref:Uncharacterized protein n=1 Tax=Capsaspora owczarzaki (strain ATCC 30864) TaxID=595528 RepID=A0A0D2WSP0_CAPO3|nr:hypothetical protein CAOG_05132 [Capsaspora owczarzaki ATCC 30864]KJE94498.1 hypothetical protein CAOG_005132 [Capsaspora owczarzaki ATCC 30864]|eukprot:XP_004346817.1 hypothetical protein CAOG_05132 [Capsaspora owczarzaki ATCC 30864]